MDLDYFSYYSLDASIIVVEKGEFKPGGARVGPEDRRCLWGLLSTNGSTDVASERFGAGETKLSELEEGDLGVGAV